MNKVCRYCGKPATRWSGVDLYNIDFKKNKLICIGPQYCCDACDHDNKWIPIGTERQYEKFAKSKRVRPKTGDILTRIQQSCVNKQQDTRTFEVLDDEVLEDDSECSN